MTQLNAHIITKTATHDDMIPAAAPIVGNEDKVMYERQQLFQPQRIARFEEPRKCRAAVICNNTRQPTIKLRRDRDQQKADSQCRCVSSSMPFLPRQSHVAVFIHA